MLEQLQYYSYGPWEWISRPELPEFQYLLGTLNCDVGSDSNLLDDNNYKFNAIDCLLNSWIVENRICYNKEKQANTVVVTTIYYISAKNFYDFLQNQ